MKCLLKNLGQIQCAKQARNEGGAGRRSTPHKIFRPPGKMFWI